MIHILYLFLGYLAVRLMDLVEKSIRMKTLVKTLKTRLLFKRIWLTIIFYAIGYWLGSFVK